MLSEPKGLNEECGVFGIWGNPNAASITHLGLHTLQHRGQEGAGIVGLTKDGMRRHYGLGLLSEVFTNTDQLTPLMGGQLWVTCATRQQAAASWKIYSHCFFGFLMKPLHWRITAI